MLLAVPQQKVRKVKSSCLAEVTGPKPESVSCLAEGPKPGQEEIQYRDRQSQDPDSVGLLPDSTNYLIVANYSGRG